MRIRNANNLYLCNHDISRIARIKTTAGSGHFSGIGSSRYDRGFFYDHGDETFLSINDKVHSHTHWQLICSDDIFNAFISYVIRKCTRFRNMFQFFWCQSCKFGNFLCSLFHGKFMKSGILICFHDIYLLLVIKLNSYRYIYSILIIHHQFQYTSGEGRLPCISPVYPGAGSGWHRRRGRDA